ncbi:hypothetical protein D3C72_1000970 [compost metagenome]
MDVHVAHRREHQLASRIVMGQRAVGMAFVVTQGDDFAVLDLQGFKLGTGAGCHIAVDVKSGLQQHVVEVVMFRGDVHRFARLAGVLRCLSSIRDGAGRAKQRAGSDHFAALADKLTAAFILFHRIFLLVLFYAFTM